MTRSKEGWESVRQLKQEGKLVPFIGSGLSAELGVPRVDGIVDIIASELEWDPEILRLAGDLPQLAEYYLDVKHHIGSLRSKLDIEFHLEDSKIRNSRCHMALVDCKFPVIYTTNYDDLLERAHQIKKLPFRAIATLADLAEAPANVTTIIKFHGTFSNDDTLVLTESSYFDRLEFDSALDIRLRSEILGKALLFIGYSFNDINVRYLIYKLHKLRSQQKLVGGKLPLAIMTTFSADDVQRTLWKRREVAVVELNPIQPTSSLAEFLEYLQ
jgi:hypothetical protein